jgi:hypothetical protein
MRLTVDQEIEKPPAEVFRFIATNHFENHPKWDPSIIELTPTSAGPMREGATARLVRSDRGKRVDGTMTVTDYQPDRSFAAISCFGPFELSQRAVCDALPHGTARLQLTIDTRATGPLRLLLPLLRSRFRQSMTTSLQTIKQQVEAAPPAEQ